jgi:hypothetical protein
VVLTEKALLFLEQLQMSDNGYLKETREELTNVISHLIDATAEADGERLVELNELIRYLNIFNRQIKDLMKP